MTRQRLVLLDFDGTLTRSDTFLEFIRFYHGRMRFLAGFLILSPALVAMKLKLVANDTVKQVVLRFFFRDTPAEVFNRRCSEFANARVPRLLRSSVAELLSKEKALNSRIVIVSASPENWVKPWCLAQNIECLATQLEVKDQKISGNIEGENCYGPEKVARIRKLLEIELFHPIIAYGDSRGDREMLALADESFYRAL